MRKYAIALAAFLTPLLLSAPAYASDFVGDGQQQGGGRYSVLTNAVGDLTDVMEQVFAVMVSNPLFVVLLGASLFALGVRIFKKVKRAARG